MDDPMENEKKRSEKHKEWGGIRNTVCECMTVLTIAF